MPAMSQKLLAILTMFGLRPKACSNLSKPCTRGKASESCSSLHSMCDHQGSSRTTTFEEVLYCAAS